MEWESDAREFEAGNRINLFNSMQVGNYKEWNNSHKEDFPWEL